MNSDQSSGGDFHEYPPLPSGQQAAPEWQAARALDERAQDAQGRMALGCCIFWLSSGGYLLTALPPMGDVHGGSAFMMIYTAEHLVRIEGENLHVLAWAMKQQQIDDVQVTADLDEQETPEWVITSITAQERSED